MKSNERKPLKLGLLGCGNVGASFLYAVNHQRILPGVEIGAVAVRNRSAVRAAEVYLDGAPRRMPLPADCVPSWASVDEIISSDVDVVVDTTAADLGEALASAMSRGKDVVTANKKLLAARGNWLGEVAATSGVQLLGAACIGGKIDIRRNATYHRELAPRAISAMVSGTCGFILHRESLGDSYAAALQTAQELGYAEQDASQDTEGYDALAKLKLLAFDYFGARCLDSTVFDALLYREGIVDIASYAHKFARAHGRTVKLVAHLNLCREGALIGYVAPTLVESDSFLGQLEGPTNGFVIEDSVGPATSYGGPGAGGYATAAAVLGDIAALSTSQLASVPHRQSFLVPAHENASVRSVIQSLSPQHERGVLEKKLHVLTSLGLSVENIGDEGYSSRVDGATYDFIVLERALLGQVLEAKRAIESLSSVHGPAKVILIQGNRPFSLT